MEILIDDNSRLSEIQAEFKKYFPFLKIEFFNFDPDPKKVFRKENLIGDTDKLISEIRHIHNTGSVRISGQELVQILEKQFKENFGINIQVFRKSGGNWLLTSKTDKWTLHEQNKMGKEMDEEIKEGKIEDFDHEQP